MKVVVNELAYKWYPGKLEQDRIEKHEAGSNVEEPSDYSENVCTARNIIVVRVISKNINYWFSAMATMIYSLIKYRSKKHNLHQVPSDQEHRHDGFHRAVVVWTPHDSLFAGVPFSEGVFTLALIIFYEHLLSKNGHAWAWHIDPADSHGANARTHFTWLDRLGLKVLGLIFKVHELFII